MENKRRGMLKSYRHDVDNAWDYAMGVIDKLEDQLRDAEATISQLQNELRERNENAGDR